jgi:hypothetical protein
MGFTFSINVLHSVCIGNLSNLKDSWDIKHLHLYFQAMQIIKICFEKNLKWLHSFKYSYEYDLAVHII